MTNNISIIKNQNLLSGLVKGVYITLFLPVSISWSGLMNQIKPDLSVNNSERSVQVNIDKNSPFAIADNQTEKISFKAGLSQVERDQVNSKPKEIRDLPIPNRSSNKRSEGPSFEAKRQIVQDIAKKYNIDWKILEAVWQVETGKSWDTAVSSSAGARGPMQFMPGTFKGWAQDGNADGITDIYNAQDALASAANMLNGRGLKDGDVRSALYAYNHADWYVNKVKNIADSI